MMNRSTCGNFVLGDIDSSEIGDLNHFRSLECEIMDWADDTAYCLNDLVDSMNAGFLRFERVKRWAEKQNLQGDQARHAEAILSAIREGKAEARFSKKIGSFIRCCSLIERSTPALFDHQPVSLRFVGRSELSAPRPTSTNDSLRNSFSTILNCINWSAKAESSWKAFSKPFRRVT